MFDAHVRTAIHWHGLHQEMNGANDGVPGVTQCTPCTFAALIFRSYPPRQFFHLFLSCNELRPHLVPQPFLASIPRRNPRPYCHQRPLKCQLGYRPRASFHYGLVPYSGLATLLSGRTPWSSDPWRYWSCSRKEHF